MRSSIVIARKAREARPITPPACRRASSAHMQAQLPKVHACSHACSYSGGRGMRRVGRAHPAERMLLLGLMPLRTKARATSKCHASAQPAVLDWRACTARMGTAHGHHVGRSRISNRCREASPRGSVIGWGDARHFRAQARVHVSACMRCAEAPSSATAGAGWGGTGTGWPAIQAVMSRQW